MPRQYTPRVERTCENCGKVCMVHQYRADTFRYCSKSCHSSAKIRGSANPRSTGKIERTCLYCGSAFSVYPSQLGRDRGDYCSRSCRASGCAKSGSEHPNWKGGRYIGVNGYVYVRHDGKSQLEHRVVMEKHLGRMLNRAEHVHHINGKTTDNRLENLQVVSASEHPTLHAAERRHH